MSGCGVDGNLYELSEEIPLEKNIKHNIEIEPIKGWTINADYSYVYRTYEFDSRLCPCRLASMRA